MIVIDPEVSPLRRHRVGRHRNIVSFILYLVFLASMTQARGSLRADLANAQSKLGESIVQLEERSIKVILFSRGQAISVPLSDDLRSNGGSLSMDGRLIAFQQSVRLGSIGPETRYDRILSIRETHTSTVRQFPKIKEPTSFCWSPNGEELLFVSPTISENGTVTSHALQMLTLKSGKIIAVDSGANISSQCWNADGLAFVFEKGGTLHIFDLKTGGSRVLTSGVRCTWSPDSHLIAFRSGSSYYTVEPTGSNAKLLFKGKSVLSPLWWSPDSRYVAYVAEPAASETAAGIPDELDVRVRRLSDGQEETVYRFPGIGRPISFDWIKSPELTNKAEATDRP